MDLASLTPQQIFDKVAARLRDGTGQAVLDSGLCVYDDGNGHCCAVGIFLTSPELKKTQGSIGSLLMSERGTAEEEAFLELHRTLLGDLQYVHDNSAHWDVNHFSEYGERELGKMADRYDLNYTAPGAST